ncbi:MAG TPA: ABC transporter substrate-binding protein [Vicinamibacterales bacterium]|nr:ABC transporter substrate-binding protein [Vicinamibacterales bacterium]
MRLTQATLVRLNHVSGELEPWLAASWTSSSADGRVWTLKLRPGLVFSDGAPFTAADVQFTFQALYDKKVASPLAASLLIDNKPLDLRAIDDTTLVLTMPAPYGPGLSLLDAIPILPRHKLEAAFTAGAFREAWGLSTPPADLAGLGPFVLKTYVPGERMIFARNPHYWRQDENGAPLPRLDELELQIVPEQNAELLRLQGGTTDLMTDEVRPEDLAGLRRLEASGAVQLVQAGVSINPDAFWFNLTPGANKDRPWLQSEELRRAISYAVDRKAFVDTVFLGAAEPIYGPITSGNREWFMPDLPKTEHDVARAKALLASIGLTDRNGDGMLEDKAGREARFSILTQKGHTILEQSVAVLREQLGKVGLKIDVVSLEQTAMLEKFFKGDYEAMYFHILTDSFDPGRNLDFWVSSRDFHVWQPGQRKPARPWEATIDDLMQRESTTTNRDEARRLFAEAQKTLADHLPIVYFAAPQVTIAMSSRVRGATPSVLPPLVLWNADVLWVTAAGRAGRQ